MMALTNMTLKRMQRLTFSALLCGLVGLSTVSAPAYAQSNAQPSERRTKVVESMSIGFSNKLVKVQEFFAEEGSQNFQAALRELDSMKRDLDKYNTMEKANLYQTYAYVYYELDQMDGVLSAYESLINLPEATDKAEALYMGALYTLAQIYNSVERYADAARVLERWFQLTPTPGSAAYALLSFIYYQNENFDKALPAIESAITIESELGNQVNENWYNLALFMYTEKEEYRKSFEIVKILVQQYPKKQYYAQLANFYGALQEEFNQYSTYAAMHDAKMLEAGTELVTYSQFLLQNEFPYKAAVVLEEGLKSNAVERNENNLKLLAGAWLASREDTKAIPVLEEAAKLSETGDLYHMLSNTYLSLDNWDKALETARSALNKGRLQREDQLYIVEGTALFNLKRYDQAVASFERAARDERSARHARQFIRHIRSEQEREMAARE